MQEPRSATFQSTRVLFLFLALFSLLLVSSPTIAQVKEAKQVLLVEDQMSAPAVEAIAREFEAELTSKSPDPIDFFRESLDTILIPKGNYQAQVKQWYELKYSKRKLDLVVAIGPEAHKFLQTEHARFFPGVPVVFLLDLKPLHEEAPDPDITGLWMDFDPVATVNVARQLLPATKHVAVVAGSSLFDQLLTHAVQTKLEGYQGVDFIYLTDLDLGSLLGQVRSLSNDTIILYLTITKDRYQRHLFARYTLPLVSRAANVPVFGLFDKGVGLGFVGGHVTSFSDQGPMAAEIALRLLGGEKPGNIPIVTVANRYMFDWKELLRWQINTSRLPPNAVILDRDPGVWERYKNLIIAAVALLLLQAALLIYLLFERARRRRSQRALEEDIGERSKAEATLIDLSGRLINAQEEERSRLARELHDDFNQRLAMLAIELERTAMIIPQDTDKAVERVRKLCNQTMDIGSDLHSLCHTLHSSTLDVLGLVEGVRSLCAEFEEQQGVRIEFLSHDVPRKIPSGTALCLFRIAQEALRNIQKHSGAQEAFVELTSDGEQIALVVADAGIGFEPNESLSKAGLGLRSMRERLRAVGGTIDIQSRPGAGTRVCVEVPCPLVYAAVAAGE